MLDTRCKKLGAMLMTLMIGVLCFLFPCSKSWGRGQGFLLRLAPRLVLGLPGLYELKAQDSPYKRTQKTRLCTWVCALCCSSSYHP